MDVRSTGRVSKEVGTSLLWLAEKHGVPPPKFKIRKVGTSELKQKANY